MSAWQETLTPAAEWLRSFQKSRPWMLWAVAASVVVGVLCLWKPSGGSEQHDLLNGRSFSADELPAIEAAFAKRGLSEYEMASGRSRVPRSRHTEYLAAMAEGDALPSDLGDLLWKAGTQSGPFASRSQQEESLKLAKQQMISRIIGQMDGIAKAYVLFDVAESSGLRRDRNLTASVSVESSHQQPLDRHRVTQIRHLVSSAFAGLSPNQVSVIDLNGPRYSAGCDVEEGGWEDGLFLERMRAYQNYYRQAVLGALAYVPGATVSVNVELDKKLKDVVDEVRNDPVAVSAMMREEIETEASESKPVFQSGEVMGNQGAALSNVPQSISTLKTKTSRNEERVMSTQRTHVEQAALTPSRVAVSVGVPHTYFEQIWRDLHPADESSAPPSAAELARFEQAERAKIQQAVAQVLPRCADENLAEELVTITTFRQIRETQLPVESLSPPSFSLLSSYGRILCMVAMALTAFCLLRSAWQPRTPTPPSNHSNPPAPHFSATTASAEDPAWREAMQERVQENPKAALQLLRGWLSGP